MGHFRIPGPLCVTDQPSSLDDGTLSLHLSPIQGPVCRATGGYTEPKRLPSMSPLFLQCLNPSRGLTDEDFKGAAKTLGVEVAAIQAVSEVETIGAAYDDQGRPRILFERHYFHRLTGGKYDEGYPLISNSSQGGYGKASAQYAKLEQAHGLDADAALQSASWGRFQIMGIHYGTCGFGSPQAFVAAMMRSEGEHLKAFVALLAADVNMLGALKRKDWAEFARRYNGKDYAINQYDTKMAAAYQRYATAAKATPGVTPASAASSAPRLP